MVGPICGMMLRLCLWWCLHLCLHLYMSLYTKADSTDLECLWQKQSMIDCLFKDLNGLWKKVCTLTTQQRQRLRPNKEQIFTRTGYKLEGAKGQSISQKLATDHLRYLKNRRSSKTKVTREWLALVQAYFLFAQNAPSIEWLMLYT